MHRAERGARGSPFLRGTDTGPCLREASNFRQHTLGKGIQQSRGMPLVQPFSTTESGDWKLQLCWMFLC